MISAKEAFKKLVRGIIDSNPNDYIRLLRKCEEAVESEILDGGEQVTVDISGFNEKIIGVICVELVNGGYSIEELDGALDDDSIITKGILTFSWGMKNVI